MTPLLAVVAALALGQPTDPADALPRPSPAQAAWHDCEVGMFIHFAPNTWQDREYDNLSTPLERIDPAQLDVHQWVSVAQDMNARSIVFVAKHAGGFCWWPTATTDYSLKSIAWRNGKGDLMADLAAACRAKGIKLGVYLSPQDIKHGASVGGRCATPEAQRDYERLFRAQLTELLSNYGEIFEVWFDGSLAFDVGDILAAHAPNAIVFQGPKATIRWVGNEDGVAPYPCWNGATFNPATWGTLTAADATPDGDRWLPSECDARIRDSWFWNSRNAESLKPVTQLMDMYERSVGHGGVLLLNHTPDTTGLIPAADAARAREFGDEVRRRYATALASTSGTGHQLELMLSAPQHADRVVIMEDITHGERIRAYALDTLTPSGWKEVGTGSAVGHKRIHPLPRERVSALRLRITSSVGVPIIRRLALHHAGGSPGARE